MRAHASQTHSPQRPSFSDRDTTGTSSDTTERESGTWRTQSDYDDAWVMQLVRQVDVLIEQVSSSTGGARATKSWTALKNVIDMHHASLRELRRALEDAEQQVLVSERARHRAETQLHELNVKTTTVQREIATYFASIESEK